MANATIDAKSFAQRVKSNEVVRVLDVRTPGEFRSVHLVVAKNVPLDQLSKDKVMEVTGNGSGPLYVVCQSGVRGKQACDQLSTMGIEAVNVEGGTKACLSEGLPAVRGKGVIALDRQVRITAGSFVLLGVVLGTFVSPWLFAISAFIGGGLVFSGVTDTCGMGYMLMKMPWNRATK